MEVKVLWDKRMKAYYSEVAKYFTVIGMGVFYTFIIFGSVFAFYYLKFLQWLPSTISKELIASAVVTFVLLRTRVRTFVRPADIIFLFAMEARMSGYFRKSFLYTLCVDASKLIITVIIIAPLLKDTDRFICVLLLGLLILNIRLVWVEQWLNTTFQWCIHRTIRIVVVSAILYFTFINNWLFAGSLLLCNGFLYFYLFAKDTVAVNWDFLINKERRAMLTTYNYINFYIEVPELKHLSTRRPILGWIIKRFIIHKRAATHLYLYSLLFSRYNEFYYLYLRLSVIGFTIIYFVPAYGWIVTLLFIAMTMYQILPLQLSLTDMVRLFPIPPDEIKQSFKKILWYLSILQLAILDMAFLFKINFWTSVVIIPIELVFVYWFIYFFLSKRIQM